MCALFLLGSGEINRLWPSAASGSHAASASRRFRSDGPWRAPCAGHTAPGTGSARLPGAQGDPYRKPRSLARSAMAGPLQGAGPGEPQAGSVRAEARCLRRSADRRDDARGRRARPRHRVVRCLGIREAARGAGRRWRRAYASALSRTVAGGASDRLGAIRPVDGHPEIAARGTARERSAGSDGDRFRALPTSHSRSSGSSG